MRELQTMAILLDVYLGVPVIYSTFMQYDELAHHFGPSSKQALWDLKRTDGRISEIARMARVAAGRQYDIVILSDHGMTPAKSYRVQFGESLGSTIQRSRAKALVSHASFSHDSEYSDVGPRVVDAAAQLAPPDSLLRSGLRRARDWLRSRYGLRELILPEKYRVDAKNDVVVTYSSCLALVYFAESESRLTLEQISGDERWTALYESLLANEGIGLVATVSSAGVHCAGRGGSATIARGAVTRKIGVSPLTKYGDDPTTLAAIESLVSQRNAGDIVLFGEYDGNEIISFDDQVGAHGCAGGDQVRPFILGPAHLNLKSEILENARDVHRAVMLRYAAPV